MKNLKLILSVLVLAMGVISFVNAQSSCSPVAPNLYSCEIWQQCPFTADACSCTILDWWEFLPGDFCWNLCSNEWSTGVFICNDFEYCPWGGLGCSCNGSPINPYEPCYPASNPSSCTYSWKTINSWLSMQLYKTTTWLCEQKTISCNSSWSVNLSNSIDNGYIYTWCTLSGWLPSSSCSLWWISYTSGFNKTGYSVPSGSCTLNSIQCNNWLWSEDTWRVQYDICFPTPSGWWGGWWGGSSTPTCTFVDLMCVGGTYQKKPGVNCINWNLWNTCSGTGVVITTGNTATGAGLNPVDYTKIWDISNSPYSQELNLAYLYAYNMWITTMPNIFKADLEWKLIRSHMAKMMVQWSKKVLGVKANTGIVCDFDDIDYLKWQDLYAFIIQSCQMWLMGVDNKWIPKSSFDPTGVVTRAQFGTVLSRAIRWDYYNGWDPFYNYHLEALNSVEIMKKISQPWDYELRGWVMLMLNRSHTKLVK